ncbi:MAG TPA: hypothetical protein VL332_09400 [Candidatus Saccharimonadaceae bacterium]|jgi:3,4-dihydroxyphenylacetate 2,3-dioxygenase|nr:hypothetical protein [Candidatus Saccharimonadaceae bacterium]
MLNPHVFLAPHRPTLLVDEQRGHHTPMLDAFGEASETFWGDKPEAVVALSARWNAEGPFRVDQGKHHRTVTDYSGFGVELRYDCPGHPALARALVEAGTRAGVRVAAATRGVDSGVTVPLHFLASRRDVKVVPLSLPDAPAEECRAWGAAIAAALERWPERVTFVAGGVLSFNEHAWNLRRDVPEAEAFDKALVNELGRAAWSEVATMVEEAPPLARPEAGLRHVDVLRGVIGEHATAVVRAYEGTFGIGAALVEFTRAPREA